MAEILKYLIDLFPSFFNKIFTIRNIPYNRRNARELDRLLESAYGKLETIIPKELQFWQSATKKYNQIPIKFQAEF